MGSVPKVVFVLGAGCTRAFYHGAPLVEDKYNLGPAKQRISGLPHARSILETELARFKDGNTINIEQLLTRLDGPMPYDRDQYIHELGVLRNSIIEAFRQKLAAVKEPYEPASAFAGLARYCVERAADCITFNYDDFFDQALWELGYVCGPACRKVRWNPDEGYGFFTSHIRQHLDRMPRGWEEPSMVLLKLHGSINWRVLHGAPKPYSYEAIAHDSSWYPDALTRNEQQICSRHLEDSPFIVLPILAKSELLQQPLLRLVWSKAYESVSLADHLIFVGYSFSPTDMAAKFLFSEACQPPPDCKITVVNNAGVHERNDQYIQEKLRVAYGRVFGEAQQIDFKFMDAQDWCKKLIDGAIQPYEL